MNKIFDKDLLFEILFAVSVITLFFIFTILILILNFVLFACFLL